MICVPLWMISRLSVCSLSDITIVFKDEFFFMEMTSSWIISSRLFSFWEFYELITSSTDSLLIRDFSLSNVSLGLPLENESYLLWYLWSLINLVWNKFKYNLLVVILIINRSFFQRLTISLLVATGFLIVILIIFLVWVIIVALPVLVEFDYFKFEFYLKFVMIIAVLKVLTIVWVSLIIMILSIHRIFAS